MRLAIDIDSTLHHYWDQLDRISRKRFGVALPYEDQVEWGITQLRDEQLRAAVAETHKEEHVLSAEPYEGAVEAIARWHGEGHFIHITSHRSIDAHDHTLRWLERIGLPHHELYCSYDKVARCQEIGIDVLIDDSPVNLQRAVDAGIVGATLLHPWNRELCEMEDIVCGEDWAELAGKIDALLARYDGPPAASRT
jgi:uncharacterized HAD superfamily protein